jgi:hypothetical protein
MRTPILCIDDIRKEAEKRLEKSSTGEENNLHPRFSVSDYYF